ncbi:L,D-transpeptidase family protein [Sphingomicrobium sp. XHP0239]|uniref:L,D-transpeptidase family protein n=1 Tax=Sphingomicrobium maritimum TaxID=3133972 RepID=UPI0031CC9F8E
MTILTNSMVRLGAASILIPAAAALAAPPPPSMPPADDARVPVEEVAVDASQDAVANDQSRAAVQAVPVWQAGDVDELLSYIDVIHQHGLTPADYDAAGLRAIRASGSAEEVSAAATERYERLANDLARGHAGEKSRIDWHVVDPDLQKEGDLRYLTLRALYDNDITGSLDALMPTHPQYEALKAALKKEIGKGSAARAKNVAEIRLNMDRWRWLPRDLGDRYIIVNVPAYTAALVENGETLSRHRAVAGAKNTPTPQLSVEATGVIFNPYWNVPKSIEPEVRGKAGYEAVRGDDGSIIRWRQPPGPSNSLGRVKFVMYNPHLIYLHDTNARGLFNAEERARSHGCIRTENILKLATILLEEDGGDWSAAKTAEVINSGENTGAKFVKPIPVHIVYFSAVAKADGDILAYEDIYNRDKPVLATLNDAPRGADPLAPRDEVAALN